VFHVAEPQAAKAFLPLQVPAGWIGEMRTAPRRQIMFCLSVSIGVTSSSNDERVAVPEWACLRWSRDRRFSPESGQIAASQ